MINYKTIDLSNVVAPEEGIAFKNAIVRADHDLVLAVVHITENGQEPPYGLRLDTHKRIFVDHLADPQQEAFVVKSTDALVQALIDRFPQATPLQSSATAPSSAPTATPTPTLTKSFSDTDLQSAIDNHKQWLGAGRPPNSTNRAILDSADLTSVPVFDFTGKNLAGASLVRSVLQKLSLQHVDLSDTDLSFADMTGTDLTGANLTGANLTNANLTEANLTGANFTNANLRHTILRHANLQDADLTDVKSLTPGQLGGANLQGITPKDSLTFDSSSQVDEALKNAGKLYQTLITLTAFSVLVIFSTTDLDIVTHSGTTKLPLVDSQISREGFFIVVPWLILITLTSFYLHLLRAWEMMSEFPAIFPDGRTIDQKTYPLHLNSLILGDWPQLKNRIPRLIPIKKFFSLVTSNGIPLIVLECFYLRFTISQNYIISISHLFTIISLILLIIFSETLKKNVITGKESVNKYFRWRGNQFTYILYFLVITITVILGVGIQSGIVPSSLTIGNLTITSFTVANINHAEIVTKPTDWSQWSPRPATSVSASEISKDWKEYLKQYNEITTVPVLAGIKLRGADADGVFLAKANLTRAQMDHANFSKANLSLCKLFEVDFTSTKLIKADLLRADLREAKLHDADCFGADMRGGDLSHADCTRTNLQDADLRGANLGDVDLRGAILIDTKLTGTNLERANLQGVRYTPAGTDATQWPAGITSDYLKKAGAITVDKDNKPIPLPSTTEH